MIQPCFKNIMIYREDMLALTRRMNVKRTSITRIAGAYIDREGFVDGTFNTRFLKLSAPERARNLAIAKAIPFAETNLSLKRYVIPQEKRGEGTLWQLLMGARSAGLENDALLTYSTRSRRRGIGRAMTTAYSFFMTAMTSRRRLRTMRGWGSQSRFLNI